MQQLNLIPLIAQLYPQQVTHRQHPHPLLIINHRQMTTADLLHAFERLVRRLVTTDHGPQGTGHIAELHGCSIVSRHDDPVQQIAFREDAHEFPFRVEHAQHLRPQEVPLFGPRRVVPSMQPYHAIDDGRWVEQRIGPVRIKTTYAFRTLLDTDAPLASFDR